MEQNIDELEEEILIASSAFLAVRNLKIMGKTCKKRKKFAVNPYLKDRKSKGRFYNDFQDMQKYPPAFKENFHMSEGQFQILLNLVEPCLRPKRYARRDSFSAAEKLAMTLEYLASGSMQRHIASAYRVSKQRLGVVIEKTCEAIYNALKPQYLKVNSVEDWLEVSNKYHTRWNLPHCLGSVDGKHVSIVCPQNAGSAFYNYKGYHSIILMAVADANYKFIYVDIGAYGSEGDSTVFRNSDFGRDLALGKLQLPPDSKLGGDMLPFFFIGDDAFPLQRRLLKPYVPKRGCFLKNDDRIFNYRLSRARRCVENSFGILCSRWCCLSKTINMKPDRVQKIVAACCTLHNYLMQEGQDCYCPNGFADSLDDNGDIVEGLWRKRIPTSSLFHTSVAMGNGRHKHTAMYVRDRFREYVNSEAGSLKWQKKQVLG